MLLTRYIFVYFIITILNGTSLSQDLKDKNEPDLTLLAKFESEKNIIKYKCVAGNNIRDHAITFVTSFNDQEQTPVSKYYNLNGTEFSVDNYDCNFNYNCPGYMPKNNLNIVQAGIYPFDNMAPVLDDRWQKFELKYLDSTKKIEIMKINERKSISLSLLINKISSIILCEDINLKYYSNCIWLTLNNKNIKVYSSEIINLVNTYPEKSSEGNETEHKTSIPLHKNKWFHLTISNINYNDKMLNITIKRPENDKKIFSLTYKLNKFNNLIYFQDEGHGLWKMHDYKFLSLNSLETNKIYTIREIEKDDTNFICIEFYAITCETCQMIFTLGSQQKIIKKSKMEYFQSWQYVKLETEINENKISFNVEILGDKREGFWAIDDIRRCHKNEIRIIEKEIIKKEKNNISVDISCYTLKKPDYSSIMENQSFQGISTSVCEGNVNFIGKFCNISCQAITNDEFCAYYTICPSSKDSKFLCTCAAGYKGDFCNEKCELMSHGYNCQKTCDRCPGGCLRTTGKCPNPCTSEDEEGCSTEKYPYLKDSPILIKSDLTSITVRLNNTNYNGKQKPSTFQIEYAEKNNDKWIPFNGKMKFSADIPVTITNLKPITDYEIRAVLYTDNDSKSNFTPRTIYTKTSCYNVDHESSIKNIKVSDIQSDSVNITWTAICNDKIDFETSCQWCLNKTEYETESINNFKVIGGLTPSMNYNVSIFSKNKDKYIEKLNFRTIPGDLPRMIKPPEIVNTTLYSITIKFNNSFIEGNQKPRQFTIEYGKPKENWNVYNKNYEYLPEEENIITLTNLQSNTNHFIRVIFNSNQNIPYIQAKTTCDDSNNLKIIENVTITSHETSALIQWIPNCEKELKFEINCMDSKKCVSKQFKQQTKKSLLKNLKITDLKPYTNYNLAIKIENKSETYQHNFTTKFSNDSQVQKFSLYSIIGTTASFRFQVPHLEKKVQQYDIWSHRCESTGLEPKFYRIYHKNCDIWTEYFCFELQDVPKTNCFEIQVRAKFENTEEPGKIKSLQFDVSKKCDPPKNFLINLNQGNYTISWDHPDFIQGELIQFLITIKLIDTDLKHNNFSIATYHVTNTGTLHYSCLINQITNLPLSSSYNVAIKTITKSTESSEIVEKIVTEPVKPVFLENKIELVNRNNSILQINIPKIADETDAKNSKIYIFICNLTSPKTDKTNTENDIYNKLHNLSNCTTESWIAEEFSDLSMSKVITIGSNNEKPLKLEIPYEITVFLVNTYNENIAFSAYSLFIGLPEEDITTFNPLFLLLILPLILIPLIFIIIKFYKNKTIIQSRTQVITNEESPMLPIPPPKVDIQQNNNGITQTNKFSKVIKINYLSQYVQESLKNDELKKQHTLFTKGATKPWDYGMKPENKFKNRYVNLTAYDHSRVVLEKLIGDEYSDFINANFIDGYQQKNAYIATQGPKLNTISDFWRMIWQFKVEYIVMLANLTENGKKKCEKYWPSINETKKYSEISIRYLKSDIYADYEYRLFEIKNKNDTRIIEQLHFTSWPDHGVPLYPQSLVPFLQKILKIPIKKAPLVVHCSAGVGRTGTIILADICLRMAAFERQVDVLKYLKIIRDQRANLVDNFEQYKLVHMILLECLISPNTNIPCDSNFIKTINNLVESDEIQKQLDYLQETAWHNKAMITNHENFPQNLTKNRFSDIIPDNTRIYITRYPSSDSYSDYINAVPVAGFRIKKQFIVTQNPLPHTVKDFWRMISEYNVKVIVSLNEFEENDTSCEIFYPLNKNEMNPLPHYNITHQSDNDGEIYNTHNIILNNEYAEEDNEIQHVKVLQFKNWKRNEMTPKNMEQLISFIEEAQNLSRHGDSMVVTCYDGAKASGLFVALSFVIEKMKLEQNCDVCLAVRTIRMNREQFIKDKEQFIYLYKAAILFISLFETYSNFSV